MFGDINAIPFYLHEISDDRTEVKLRVKLSYASAFPDVVEELQSFKNIAGNLKATGRLNNIALNFGSNNIFQVVNLKVDCTDKGGLIPCQNENENNCTELVVYAKLQYPLLEFISEKQYCFIAFKVLEDYIDTFTIRPEEMSAPTKQLRGPRFDTCSTVETSNSTELKTWNNLLDANVLTTNAILREIFSGSDQIPLNLDYTDFKNFVVYGSAEERVKNYDYKRKLIEHYNSQNNTVRTSNASGSIYAVSVADNYLKRSYKVLDEFDDFEKYLHYSRENIFSYDITGSILPAPKYISGSQLVNYHTTSSQYIQWYDGILNVAKNHDFRNYDSFYYNTPDHILRDPNNSQYVIFLHMMGQHFDNIYNYVRELTEIHRRDEHPQRGIPNKLLPYYARSLGWKIQNTKQLSDLWLYKLGVNPQGNYLNVSGSLVSQAHENLSHQIWRRVVNNLPSLLKTKGTERSIKALFSIYGIPFTLISVKEYGGPKTEDYSGDDTPNIAQDRFHYLLNLDGNQYIEMPRGMVTSSLSLPPQVPSTVEFRFQTSYTNLPSMSLWSIEDYSNRNNILHNLELVPYGQSLYGVNTYGYLKYSVQEGTPGNFTKISQTGSLLPYFDGDIWSVRLYSDEPVYPSGSFQSILHVDSAKASDFVDARISLSSSFSISGSSNSSFLYSLGAHPTMGQNTHYVLLGGTTGSFSSRFSGSLQGYKEYFSSYSTQTFYEHVLNPGSYHTDTYSGSFDELYKYYPLGLDNLKHDHVYYTEVSSSHPKRKLSTYTTASFKNFIGNDKSQYLSGTETYYQYIPSIGANNPHSNKIRIESSTLNGQLSPNSRVEISNFDKTQRDSNRLAIVFSPTDQINRDVANQFGPFNFESFIGDPEDGPKDYYPSLSKARTNYFKKFNRANDIGKYIEIFSLYDYTVFSQLKQLVPARANLIAGVLIEPSILERSKVKRTFPTINVLNLDTLLDTKVTALSSSLIPTLTAPVDPTPDPIITRSKHRGVLPIESVVETDIEKFTVREPISYIVETDIEDYKTTYPVEYIIETEIDKESAFITSPYEISIQRQKYLFDIEVKNDIVAERVKYNTSVSRSVELGFSRQKYQGSISNLSQILQPKQNYTSYDFSLTANTTQVKSSVVGVKISSKSTTYTYVKNNQLVSKTIEENNVDPFSKQIKIARQSVYTPLYSTDNVIGDFTVKLNNTGSALSFNNSFLTSSNYYFTINDYNSGINLNTLLSGPEFSTYIKNYNYTLRQYSNFIYKNKPEYEIEIRHISGTRSYKQTQSYKYFYSSSGKFIAQQTSPLMLFSPVYLSNRTGSKNGMQRELDFAINKEYGAFYSQSLHDANYQFTEDASSANCRFKGSKLSGPDINIDSTNTLYGTPVVIVNFVEENPIRI